MEKTLEFPVLLRLIDERSTAFRAAAMSAPGLELQVPTCPEWTLLDLVQHLGEVHRFWAAAVNAGPAAAPPAESASEGVEAAPREREALLAWSAASTRQLLDALREAGPDRGCWTWWGASQSPQTSGAVARHQLHSGFLYHHAPITGQAIFQTTRRATPRGCRPGPRGVGLQSPCCFNTHLPPHARHDPRHRRGPGPGGGRRLRPEHGQ